MWLYKTLMTEKFENGHSLNSAKESISLNSLICYTLQWHTDNVKNYFLFRLCWKKNEGSHWINEFATLITFLFSKQNRSFQKAPFGKYAGIADRSCHKSFWTERTWNSFTVKKCGRILYTCSDYNAVETRVRAKQCVHYKADWQQRFYKRNFVERAMVHGMRYKVFLIFNF